MKINPENGYITLTDLANQILLPKMSIEQVEALGFDVQTNSGRTFMNIRQKTLPTIYAEFTDRKLTLVSIHRDLTSSTIGQNLLNTFGIEAKAYSWGEVKTGVIPQQGEGWLSVNYY
jgi:hypothetical protein